MLKISNLSVFVADEPIINAISLAIEPSSVHLLMGPNGSGKSTFSYALAGHPRYTVQAEELAFLGEELQTLPPDKRAQKGLFLAVQNPPEIPGVTVLQFLKEAHAACTGQSIGVETFKQDLDSYLKLLKLDVSFLQRSLHENFSGGEKKRLELLQLMVLKPKLAILDEIDSGLDIDALSLVSSIIEQFKKESPASSLLIITHNPRIAEFLKPDHVHILRKGVLALSGSSSLIPELAKKGYDELLCS